MTTKKHLCIFEIWKKFVNLAENNNPMPWLSWIGENKMNQNTQSHFAYAGYDGPGPEGFAMQIFEMSRSFWRAVFLYIWKKQTGREKDGFAEKPARKY